MIIFSDNDEISLLKWTIISVSVRLNVGSVGGIGVVILGMMRVELGAIFVEFYSVLFAGILSLIDEFSE